MRIYADNAATTKMSKAVIDIMAECMGETYGNPSSLHSSGQRAAEVLAGARESVALVLGAEPAAARRTIRRSARRPAGERRSEKDI